MKQIFILTFLFCASCGQNTASNASKDKSIEPSTEVGKEKPVENALTFINAYVKNCNRMKDALGVVEWVNSSKLTTENFKTELKKVMEEADQLEPEMGLDADPIFNAQDYPEEGFELESSDDKTNYIVLKGKNWADFKLTIKMVKDKNNWLVDGCGMINLPNDKRTAK